MERSLSSCSESPKSTKSKLSEEDGCQVYSLEELNKRIANISKRFSKFVTVDNDSIAAIEGGKDNREQFSKQISHLKSEHIGNAKERKMVNQFSGVYSAHTALNSVVKQAGPVVGALVTRDLRQPVDYPVGWLKNLSAVTASIARLQDLYSTSGAKKPLLVELQSFPGYKENAVTPLPSSLGVEYILNIVITTQEDLKKKPKYRKVFEQFFKSDYTKAILQDSFWWYFCHKYNPSPSQDKLFDRISTNYTHLVVTWTGNAFQHVLFKNYSDLLSQAIYSSFCHSFPTSYRQFNGEFRDEIVSLMSLWFMGSKPAPRYWEKWNFHILEPSGLRKGELIKDDASRSNAIELDLGESISARRRSSIMQAKKTTTFENNNAETVQSIIKQISSVLGFFEQCKKESCAASEVPQFSKVVFNVYGRSPMVENFLLKNNLLKKSSCAVLVRRTEITKLPSYSAKTYDDVLRSRKQTSREQYNGYNKSWKEIRRERRQQMVRYKLENTKFTRCTNKLLSNPHKVRNISDLLRSPPDGKEEPEDAAVRSNYLRNFLSNALEENDEG